MLRALLNLIRGQSSFRKATSRRQAPRRRRTVLTLECLEDRAVPSTLEIDPYGYMRFTASSPGTRLNFSETFGTLTFTSSDVINVTGSGLEVYVPSGTTVQINTNSIYAFGVGDNLQINLDGGTNTVNIPSTGVPIKVTDYQPTNDSVILGTADSPNTGHGMLGHISAPVTVQSSGGTMSLILDDTGDSSPHNNVTVSNGGVTGLGNALITDAGGATLFLDAGSGNDIFTINNPGKFSTSLQTGTGVNNVWVEANSAFVNIDDQGFDSVWVSSSPKNNFTGTVANINAEVFVTNTGASGHSDTTLTVCDQGDSNYHAATLSNGSLTGLAPATILAGANVADFNVYGGNDPGYGNAYILNNPGSVITHIHTGSVNDVVNIEAASTEFSVDGPGGTVYVDSPYVSNLHGGTQFADYVGTATTDGPFSLYIDDKDATVAQNATLRSVTGAAQNILTGLSPAPIQFGSGVTNLTVEGGSGGNQYTINDIYGTLFSATFQCRSIDTVVVQAFSGALMIEGAGTVSLGTGTMTLYGAVSVQGNSTSTVLNVNDGSDSVPTNVTLQNGRISGLSAVPISYSGVSQLNVFGGSGGNDFALESPSSLSTYLHTGSANGTVAVDSTTGRVTIDGGGASNGITLGTGTLTGLQGAVTIQNQGSGTTLQVADGEDTTAHPNINLDYGSLTGLAPAAMTWGPVALDQLQIYGGSGLESYTIDNPGLFPTYITTQNSDDHVNVEGNTGLIALNGKVLAKAVTQLALHDPETVTAGIPFQVTVTAKDADGDVLKTYAGTIHFYAIDQNGNVDQGASLPADYTFTPADQGSQTFSVTLTAVGNENFGVYETDETGTYSVQGNNTVTVNPVTLGMSKPAGPVIAGVPFQVTVTAEDANGDVIKTYAGTVSFGATYYQAPLLLAIVDNGAVLPPSYTFSSADAGRHTFTVMLTRNGTAGTESLTVASTDGLASGTASVAVTPLTPSVTIGSPHGAAGDDFGNPVAVSGSYLLVGANGVNNYTGTAYLYDTSGHLLKTFQDPNGAINDTFGSSVALSGNYVLVGASGIKGFAGAVYLYSTSGQLLQTFQDPGGTAGDQFGTSVALSGNNVLIGAAGFNNTSGAAYLYDLSGQLLQTFQDPGGSGNDLFGTSVALSGSHVVVGAYGVNNFTGAAYLYGTSGNLLQTLQDPNGTAGDHFGWSVALSGSNVLVGGYGVNSFAGAAYLYDTSGQLLQTFQDPGGTANDEFGTSVALSGTSVLVGANQVNSLAGAAYLYNTSGQLLQTLQDPNGAANDVFASAVALSGANVLVGAAGVNGYVGAVDLYKLPVSSFTISAPQSATAGAQATVTITAQDGYGNVDTSYTGTINFSSADQQAGLPASYTFTGDDQGSHTFTLKPDTAGNLAIVLADSAAGISSQAFVTVAPGPVSMSQSTISLASANMQAGASTTVTLTAQDAYGNALTSGGLTVAFGLKAGSAGGSFGAVTDHGDGSYTATFSATAPGKDNISASIDGQAVTSNAPTLTVVPGPTVIVSSSSLSLGTTTHGLPGSVQSYTVSGTNLTAALTITAPTGVELSDDSGSSYHASLTLTPAAGAIPATTIDVRLSASASTGNLSAAIQDTSPGATEQDVTVSGTVTNVQDPLGQLQEQYGFHSAGNYYQNYLGFNEKWFQDRNNNWYVLQPSGMLSRWNGGTRLSAVATVNPSVWTNPALLFQAPVTLSAQAQAVLAQLEQADGFHFAGSYYQNDLGLNEKWFQDHSGVWFVLTTDGQIRQWEGGSNLGSALATVDPAVWDNPNLLFGAVAAKPSTVAVFTTAAQTLTAGQPSRTISVQLEDASGNVIQAGSGGATLILGSTSTGGTFLDTNGNPLPGAQLVIPAGASTASFEYEDTRAGTPTLTAGEATSPGKQSETVNAGPADLSQSSVVVSASSIPMGSTATVTLTARDVYGNAQTSGGLTVAFGLAAGSAGGSFATVTDHGNGTYTATLTGTALGSNTITATINGQTITSAAPTLTVQDPLGQLQEQYGFHFSGSYYQNYLGFNEKWFQDRNNNWYVLQPNGSLSRWNSGTSLTLLATVSPSVYANPQLLFQAPVTLSAQAQAVLAHLEHANGFHFASSYYQNYLGLNEKWFQDHSGVWFVLTTDGQIRQWEGGSNLGSAVATVDPAVWDNPNLLFGA